MELTEESARVCFYGDLKEIELDAAGEVCLYFEKLGLKNIEKNQRLGRVCLYIEKVIEKINNLDRPDYNYYCNNPDCLFYAVKSKKRLSFKEEMDIIRQLFIWKAIYGCLLTIKTDLEVQQKVNVFYTKNNLELPVISNEKNLANEKELIKGVSLEEIYTIITVQLNQRLGFLKHQKSVKPFVKWLLNPNADPDAPPMPLGCKTTEFKCIMDHFKLLNKELNNEVIGREKLFISHNGIPINAKNLRNTNFKNSNTKHAIENIFAPYM